MMMKNETCQRDKDFRPQLKLLPNSYQQIGIWLAVICFITMFALKAFAPDLEAIRILVKKIFLVCLLLVSISKDKTEDELTLKLRNQAFAIAFVWGVLYALVQPYFDLFIDSIIEPAEAKYVEMQAVQIITFILLIHIGFYNLLKRKR